MTRAEALHSALERTMRVAPGMATRYVLDAAREMAVAENRPIMVIASRRQVDGPSAGGGYLGWDTAEWCRAASHQNGAAPLLLLGRDHGGPYQHPRDLQTDAEPAAAMAFAKESLRHDIECGLSLIHIDGSLGRRGVEELPEVALGRTLELVSFCVDVADGAEPERRVRGGSGDTERAHRRPRVLRALSRDAVLGGRTAVRCRPGVRRRPNRYEGVRQPQHRSRFGPMWPGRVRATARHRPPVPRTRVEAEGAQQRLSRLVRNRRPARRRCVDERLAAARPGADPFDRPRRTVRRSAPMRRRIRPGGDRRRALAEMGSAWRTSRRCREGPPRRLVRVHGCGVRQSCGPDSIGSCAARTRPPTGSRPTRSSRCCTGIGHDRWFRSRIERPSCRMTAPTSAPPTASTSARWKIFQTCPTSGDDGISSPASNCRR